MLFECELSSQVLHTAARVFVILPELKTSPKGGILPAAEQKFPVLYLYHGGYDDGSCWVRRTNIERYATEKGLAVVMPSAGNSYYTDAGVGREYFTFISQELPQLVRERMTEACRTAAESGRTKRRPRRRAACGAAAATGPTRT